MKLRTLAAITSLLIGITAAAQSNDFWGQVSLQGTYGYSGLTLDTEQHYSGGSIEALLWNRFETESTAVSLHYTIRGTLPKPETGGTYSALSGPFRFDLYRGEFSYTPKAWLTLNAGRQQVDWGRGLYSRPSDIINTEASFPGLSSVTGTDPGKGFTGVSMTFIGGSDFQFLGAAAFDKLLTGVPELEKTTFAGQLSWYIAGWDLFAGYSYRKDDRSVGGAGFNWVAGDFLFTAEGAWDFTGEQYTWNAALLPASPFEVSDAALPLRASAGIEYLGFFSDTTGSVSVEYLFRGDGMTGAEAEKLYSDVLSLQNTPGFTDGAFSSISTGSGQMDYLTGRHYITGLISAEKSDAYSASLYTMINVTDPSTVVGAELSLFPDQNSEIKTAVSFIPGKGKDGEFPVFRNLTGTSELSVTVKGIIYF